MIRRPGTLGLGRMHGSSICCDIQSWLARGSTISPRIAARLRCSLQPIRSMQVAMKPLPQLRSRRRLSTSLVVSFCVNHGSILQTPTWRIHEQYIDPRRAMYLEMSMRIRLSASETVTQTPCESLDGTPEPEANRQLRAGVDASRWTIPGRGGALDMAPSRNKTQLVRPLLWSPVAMTEEPDHVNRDPVT